MVKPLPIMGKGTGQAWQGEQGDTPNTMGKNEAIPWH
jgi:hypothetical protein